MSHEKVAILGASPNPDRYSYKALKSLENHGHEVFLVYPRYDEIDGNKVYDSLSDVNNIDTLTMYVSPQISNNIKQDILDLSPKRVIFNPGAENAELQEELSKSGIEVMEACTLVLLSTDQF